MRLIRKTLPLIFAAAILAVPSEANADVTCQFAVQSIAVDTWGDLITNVSTGSNSYQWVVCSTTGSITVNNGYNGGTLTSASCSAIYTKFLTARASGRLIGISFHGPANCASLPASSYSWMTLFPTYFTL